MVNDLTLRNAFFPGTVNFSAAMTNAGTPVTLNANGQALVDTLHEKMIGTADTQPDANDFDFAVGGLVGTLCTTGTGCGSGNRTTDVIKAACGAALGSAATLVQ
jgi:hypothetical protein